MDLTATSLQRRAAGQKGLEGGRTNSSTADASGSGAPPRSDFPLRLTFLTTLPSPYSRDLFRAMHKDGRLLPTILYQTPKLPGFDWGTPTLEDWETILPAARWGTPDQEVRRALAARPADIYVVGGYSSLAMQSAMRWLRRRGLPWVFFGERPAMRQRGAVGSLLRKLAMRPAVQWSSGIAAVGSAAVDAYRRYAPTLTPIANLPYFCDLEPFQSQRASPGSFPERFRLLYCGQLIERKGVLPLFDAFEHVANQNAAVELMIAGDGLLRNALEGRVSDRVLKRIRFMGFRQVSELPELFAAADALVLPSLHDGWGVVVNQALAAGLPVIASSAVGAAQDLVGHGENGWIVPVGDVAELQKAILSLAENADRCRQFAQRSSERAESITLAAGVDRWFEFLNSIVSAAASN